MEESKLEECDRLLCRYLFPICWITILHEMDFKERMKLKQAVKMVLIQCDCGTCIKRRQMYTERYQGCVSSEGQLQDDHL